MWEKKALASVLALGFLFNQISSLSDVGGKEEEEKLCGVDATTVYLEITRRYLELRDIHSKLLQPGAHKGVIAAFLMVNQAWSSGDIVPCVTRVACYLLSPDSPPKPKDVNTCTYQMQLYQRCPDVKNTTTLKDAFRILAMEYQKTPKLCTFLDNGNIY